VDFFAACAAFFAAFSASLAACFSACAALCAATFASCSGVGVAWSARAATAVASISPSIVIRRLKVVLISVHAQGNPVARAQVPRRYECVVQPHSLQPESQPERH